MNDAVTVALIGAIPASFTGAALVITSLRTNRKIDEVKREVVTLNESTIGQLGAASETRRIHAKEETGEHITDKEQRHIDAALEEEP